MKMNWLQLLSPKRFGDKTETTTNSEGRNRFEQDYDRLVFSHPFRKLQDKTQVFPLPEDDFVHTRLTHSLEVSSVGRSLGKLVGERLLEKYPELRENGFTFYDFSGIVSAACLAHDLGNPPFGHSGETAISSFFLDNPKGQAFKAFVTGAEWSDLTSFEGNAQGFRILNDDSNSGLRLTYATLGAFTKYPKTAAAPRDKSRKSQKKYGVYRSELSLLQAMAGEMGMIPAGEEIWLRHPLTFLVEAADDICYNIIDLEDGCRLGLVPYETTRDLLAAIIGERYNQEKLEQSNDVNQKIGLLRALAINRLITESVDLFLDKEEDILSGRFDTALTDRIPSAAALSEITKLSIDKIYRCKQVLEREAGGFEVIGKLMEAFCLSAYHYHFDKNTFTPRMESVFRLLPNAHTSKLANAKSVYEAILIITDFISSLTDSHAIKLYKTIYGFSLPASKA